MKLIATQLRVSVPAAPVRQQVADRLRSAIAESLFEPGHRLIERELCELMGVGRSSIREALRQLEAEGLVKLIPHKGPVVATLGLEQEQQIREIYETRAVLEGLAGRLFAERASDAQIARLGRMVKQIDDAREAKNWDAMFKAKTRFYEVLEQGCRNAIVCAQMKLLRTRVTLLRGIILSRESRARESIEEIREILAAVERRDTEAAWSACVRHVELGAAFALQVLREEQENSRGENRVIAAD
jgi:DNA-binding GntR family transcriptional regulator